MRLMIENISDPANREAWLEARKGVITATLAYDAANIDDGSEPINAWLDLRGERAPFEGNEKTEIGTLLQDDVAELFCRRYVEDNPGATVELRDFDVFGLHDKHDFIGSSFDYEVIINGERNLLETKTTHARFLPDWDEGRIPNRARAQSMHELAVDGEARRVYTAALIFEPTVRYAYTDRNEALITELLSRELALYEMVQKGTPPDPKTPTSEHLQALFGETDGSEIIIDPSYEKLLEQYRVYNDAEKAAKGEKDKIKLQILKACGKARYATCGGYKVTVVRKDYTNFDVKKWQSEEPALFEMKKAAYGKRVTTVYPLIKEIG